MYKRFLVSLTQVIIAFFLSVSVVSAQVQPVEMAQPEQLVEQSEFIKGPYFAADESVEVDQNIDGAVYAAGGSVTISGQVTQDVLVAGGSIRIIGQVDQDVYAAGGSVFIDGVVKGNVIVAGGEVQFGPASQIDGTVMSAGERLGFNGKIFGPLYVGGQNIRLKGVVDQDVRIGGEKLTLDSTASIGGNLTGELVEWSGENVASIAGLTNLDKIETNRYENEISLGGQIAKGIYRFIWRSFALSLVIFFVPQLLKRGVDLLEKEASQAFISGLVIVFGLPFLLVALALTMIGIPLSVIGLLTYVFLLMLAWMIPSMWAGQRLLPKQNMYVQAMLGVAVIVAISLVPVIGSLFQLVLAAIGVGAVVRLVKLK